MGKGNDIKISIPQSEITQAVDKLMRYGQHKKDQLRREIQLSILHIETKAKMAVSVDTGTLMSRIEKEITNRGYTGMVHANTDYAASLEFGSRPHVIRPKRAKALAFLVGYTYKKGGGKQGGTWVVTRRVNHPGTKPRPFLVPAFEQEIPIFKMRVQNILSKP